MATAFKSLLMTVHHSLPLLLQSDWDCCSQTWTAVVRLGLLQSQGITSMNFPACPHGRRRPKLNERQIASKIKRKAVVLEEDEATP